MRVYFTLRYLLQSHEVTLYTMASKPGLNGHSDYPDLRGLRLKVFPMGKAAYAWNGTTALFSDLPLQTRLYECPDLVRTLDADVRSGAVDLLFVHLIRMAEYARPYSHLPRILDMADSISLHYKRMRKVLWSPRWLGARVDQDRVLRYEAEVPKWFDSVLIHTEEDLDWVQKQSGMRNLMKSPMGVDTDEFAFRDGPYSPRLIVYCGKLDYLPNTDAAVYFASEIFPLVRGRIPDAQFRVVGFNPPRSLRALAKIPGVEVHANVPDVRPEVSGAAVSVAPIRFGAGIQNKILQSLAMGVPVVATPLVARPFAEGTGSSVLAAGTPREFADHIFTILEHPEYRQRLAVAGRKLIETRFQWDRVFAPLNKIFDDITEKRFQEKPEVCSEPNRI